MNLNWQQGRQKNANYFKFPIYNFKVLNLGFDAYILHYPENTILPAHKDKVDGKHYRLNINLQGRSNFICKKCIIRNNIFNLFRPDKYLHALEVFSKTYKLSLGFVKFKNTHKHEKNKTQKSIFSS